VNNQRDDALSSVNCPKCHAPTAVPTHPVPPQTKSKESKLDKDGAFNACPECGLLWADNAEALKEVARDEPSDAKTGRNERGSKRKSGLAAD